MKGDAPIMGCIIIGAPCGMPGAIWGIPMSAVGPTWTWAPGMPGIASFGFLATGSSSSPLSGLSGRITPWGANAINKRVFSRKRLVLTSHSLFFVFLEISLGYSLHAINLYFYVWPVWQRIWHFVYCLFVHLHAVNWKTRACVQLFVANVALEVLCLLVLNQDLLVIEFPIAVPEQNLSRKLSWWCC